jgi:hypothetical protein
MASAGAILEQRLPELVAQIFDEHFKNCGCQPRDGARERMLGRARTHAAVLGEHMEREEVAPGDDPSDFFGKQERPSILA